MKIVFKTPHPLSIYVQNSSTPLTLYVEFQTNSPLPSLNDNQSIKRKHDPRMTIICYQQSNQRINHHLQWLLLTLSTDTLSNGALARIFAMVIIDITLSSSFSSHVISSISSTRVGRVTGISWLGSLCFVTHPNPRCVWPLKHLTINNLHSVTHLLKVKIAAKLTCT